MHVKTSIITALLLAMVLLAPQPSLADDNDIFGVATQTVEPNILIVFDTSGSMTSNHVQVCTGPEVCHEEQGDCIAGHWAYIHHRYRWVCDEYETRTVCEDTCTDAGTRTQVAKQVINDLIDEHADENRFGIMRFHSYENSTEGGYIPKQTYNSVDLYATCSVKDYFILDSSGEQKTGTDYDNAIADYKAFLHAVVNALPGSGSTPLKETLAEAGLYFAEKESWYNPSGSQYPYGTYPTAEVNAYNPNVTHVPIGYECRQNYIILMTDGEPTSDSNANLYGDYLYGEKFNNGYLPGLDDISGFLFEHDMNENFPGTQNIITYAIGFNGGDPVELQDTADRGMGAGDNDGVDDGGLYFDATSPEDLSDAFAAILGSIDQRRTTFSASVVPISDVSKAYAGDYVYMSLFQPLSGQSRWIGNLKKYSLNDTNDFASCGSQTPILDSNGMILDAAQSCWSPYADGAQVDKGGVGQILSAMADTSRHIYSKITSENDLTAPENAFTTTNTNILPGDVGETFDADKDTVINKIRMVDETWKLGDLNHSKPAVASYSGGNYIFVGSNDGMLHCFSDTSGEETWAFVPKEQFSRLKEVYTGDHSYFMDGSATVADTSGGQKIVITGERRGGNHYYAIDVSTVTSPSYLYTYTTEGQSWKQPQFMTVKTGSSSSAEVFLMTGGYDDHYDAADTNATGIGNSVFMINAASGSLVEQFDNTDISAMTKSIISAYGSDTIDDGKDIVSQIYAGDMEGHVFGFRDNDNPDAIKELDGNWQALHIFSATSSGKKMFEETDFVQEYLQYYDAGDTAWKSVVGDFVFFGTGDRANPMRTDNTNYFYCVKNDWHTENITVNKTVADFTTLDDDDASDPNGNDGDLVMLDVSDNKIQDGTEAEKEAVWETLNKKYNRGWYFALEGVGEKCLSTPVVYNGVVYFTTFTPPDGTASANVNPCESPSGGGTAKLYAINYQTGAAVFNFSTENDGGDGSAQLGKEDRYMSLDTDYITIPPNPLLIITEKGEKLSIGPNTQNVKSSKRGMMMFYWIGQ